MNRYGSLLLLVTFAPRSIAAIVHALRLGVTSGADLHAVHVAVPLLPRNRSLPLTPLHRGIEAGLVRDARRQWSELVGLVGASAAPTLEIEIDQRVRTLRWLTSLYRPNLIILGVPDQAAPSFDSEQVAAACLRDVPIPLLLLRPINFHFVRSVLARVDPADPVPAVLELAAGMAGLYEVSVSALHVARAARLCSATRRGLRAWYGRTLPLRPAAGGDWFTRNGAGAPLTAAAPPSL